MTLQGQSSSHYHTPQFRPLHKSLLRQDQPCLGV